MEERLINNYVDRKITLKRLSVPSAMSPHPLHLIDLCMVGDKRMEETHLMMTD